MKLAITITKHALVPNWNVNVISFVDYYHFRVFKDYLNVNAYSSEFISLIFFLHNFIGFSPYRIIIFFYDIISITCPLVQQYFPSNIDAHIQAVGITVCEWTVFKHSACWFDLSPPAIGSFGSFAFSKLQNKRPNFAHRQKSLLSTWTSKIYEIIIFFLLFFSSRLSIFCIFII